MANAARLEIDFPFGGKVYSVKPTFEVVAGIEAATGQSCLALASQCYASSSVGLPSLTVTGQIIYNLLKPSNKDLTAEQVSKTIFEDGCLDLYIPLGDFLSRALRGNKDHIKKAEEEAAKSEAAQNGSVENPPQPGAT